MVCSEGLAAGAGGASRDDPRSQKKTPTPAAMTAATMTTRLTCALLVRRSDEGGQRPAVGPTTAARPHYRASRVVLVRGLVAASVLRLGS